MNTFMSRWPWLAGIGLVLAGGLGSLLFIGSQALDETAYFSDVNVLRQIKHLDSEVELDVLRSRVGQKGDEEAMMGAQQRLDLLVSGLDDDSFSRRYRSTGELARARYDLQHAIRDKAALVEQFKTANAILRNSTARLPVLADEARVGIAAAAAGHALQTERVRNLLVGTLLHIEGQGGPQQEQLGADLDALELGSRALAPQAREAVLRFLAQVRAVVRESGVVNNLMVAINDVPTSQLADRIDNLLHAHEEQAKQGSERIHTLTRAFSVALAALLVYALIQLIRKHRQIERINGELKLANDNLEARVEQRTRELRSTQDELIATARRAGMAEVATDVLHNVGNILNSVNVSAGVIGRMLRGSSAQGLARGTQLLSDNAQDLPAYLTQDDKGKLLPRYLQASSGALLREHDAMAAELRNLVSSVDHIKGVVATQQAHARASAALVPVQVPELIEDALRINASAQPLPDLYVVKNFADLPAVRLDRDRVLQILINLISNAKHAMEQVADRPKMLTVQLATAGDRLTVSVADVGEGIAGDNLARIFSHGFTTRDSGHGFGLHSCALAARQMGGQLNVHSDGAGRGAAFTLELPMQAEGTLV